MRVACRHTLRRAAIVFGGHDMNCPACQHDVPAAARFCAHCGTALGAQCPGCGVPVTEGQKFCSSCGRDLRAGAASPAAPSTGTASGTASAPASAGAFDEGERRQATIVFSDLSGYTALNEQLDPEEVEDIMGRIKREALAIVEAHGGVVNQFIGDEVIALFGIPVARRDDAHRAVRAALRLHDAVRAIGAEVAARIGRQLAMHSGVNTGLIVVRRSDSRDGHYALTGDTVNTGARLLGLADADEVVVGQDTWRQIADAFDAAPGVAMEVKGKELPLQPYRILGERAGGDAGGDERPAPALVGRGEELEQLRALLTACVSRRSGRLVILRGDPGIGKSRLLRATRDVALLQGFSCHAALVLDFSAERGRDAVRSLARSLLAVPAVAGASAAGSPEDARRAALARAVESGLVARERQLFFYDLLDVTPPTALRALQAAMSEEARNQGTLEALCEVARAASHRQPLLLSVEDVHWADNWTLDCLAALAALTRDCPLLLVLTTRFESDPCAGPWRAALQRAPTTAIDLAPLRIDDALHMARQFGALPEALVRNCIDKAEGNPLFLEQLLLNGRDAAPLGLPGSIQALVLARMDRLPVAQRQALQAASVLGQRFSLEALRHLVADPGFRCEELVQNFLLRHEGADYLFCHALIRDGAYESMLRSRRRQLHELAAEWFEPGDPVLAAEHYERAEHPRAPQACLAACAAEARRHHYASALALAERGLVRAVIRADRFALSAARAGVLLDMGRAQEALPAWRAANELTEGDAERCQALVGLAQVMRTVDLTDEGLNALAEAEPLARRLQRPAELSRLHHLRGNYYFGLGRGADCLREHEQALAQGRAAGSVEAEANALGGLGDAHYMAGRMRSAFREFTRCVDLAQRHGLGRIAVANQHMVGWSIHYLNDLRESIRMGSETIDMALQVSHHRVEIISRLLLVHVQGWFIGETKAARVHLDAAQAQCRALGAKRFEGQSMIMDALLTLRDGDRREAESRARAAVAFCREHGMSFYGPAALGVLGRLTGSAAERRQLNAEAEDMLAAGSIGHNYFEFHAAAIESALERSDWDEADRLCTAFEQFTAVEPLPLSDLMIARGRALARLGRGSRDSRLEGELRRLRDQAAQHEINVLLPALDVALGHR
jgi:class 3 adenylate cyclase/tetratricopeptide (TPR) repeat protein